MDVRKTPDAMLFALVAAHNQAQVDAVSTSFHANKTTVPGGEYQSPTTTRVIISAATATDTATLLVMVNELKTDINIHFVDAGAHDTAVSAVVTTATATNTATAVALANALKAAYNVHLADTGVHYNDDATNAVTNANATDLATALTLVNELKGDFNNHIASAPSGSYIQLVDA